MTSIIWREKAWPVMIWPKCSRGQLSCKAFDGYVCFVDTVFHFQNLILPLILIIAIQGSIWINFVIPFKLKSHFFHRIFIGVRHSNGATIDYGII